MLRPAAFSLKIYRAEDIPQSECTKICTLVVAFHNCHSYIVCKYTWHSLSQLLAVSVNLEGNVFFVHNEEVVTTMNIIFSTGDYNGLFYVLVDSGFFEGVKKVLHVGEVEYRSFLYLGAL